MFQHNDRWGGGRHGGGNYGGGGGDYGGGYGGRGGHREDVGRGGVGSGIGVGSGDPKNDCEIVCVNKQQRFYAEMIEGRLKNLGLRVDVLFPNPEIPLLKILDNISVIGYYQLPLDYLDTWTDKVAKVTIADIRAAFARKLSMDRMVTVVVGAEADARAKANDAKVAKDASGAQAGTAKTE